MADNKKYYYMRLKEGFFESDALQVMESMPDGCLYSNILLKMYLKSLKNNGKLMFNEVIPYNPQMLATITRHNVGVVEKALSIFRKLGLVEVLDNGAIYMLDIQNYIGRSTTEADRKRAYRDQIESEKVLALDKCPDKSLTNVGHFSDISTPEIEIEIEKELDIEIDNTLSCENARSPRKKYPYKEVVSLYNSICVSLPKVKSVTTNRRNAMSARFKQGYDLDKFKELFEMAEASDFLTGRKERTGKHENWRAGFDWLMNENNGAKVLEGHYPNTDGNRQPVKPKQTGFSNFEQRDTNYDALVAEQVKTWLQEEN